MLVVEPEAAARVQTFVAAATLDPQGGILGGCATEPGGWLRFGTVFSTVPYGPYPVEPFALVDALRGKSGAPQPDAIDAIAPGIYVVDREAFVAAGGFNPSLGSPWRVYDLCARLRAAGRPVRWDSRLMFGLDLLTNGPADAVDHRDFITSWAEQLSAHYDLDTPARGAIRRPIRQPFGQSEVVTAPLPPVKIVLCGEGELGASALRNATRIKPARIEDVRGDNAAARAALERILRGRSDSYLAVVDASTPLDKLWLERLLIELEWASNVCAVRHEGLALLALGRIPLDLQLPVGISNPLEAIDALIDAARGRGKKMRRLDGASVSPATRRLAKDLTLSVAIVAHSKELYHRSSFEALYAGDLGVDFHVVATPLVPQTLAHLRTHPTLDIIVDDSRGLTAGVNAALTRSRGDLAVVIGDDFYPPSQWLDMVREAFALRPDAGIIAFSSVYVEGPQQVPDIGYPDIVAFRTYVAQRKISYRREARLADRIAALAFAIDARALAAVGGFDERLGVGRWGVEDLALRVRAAGYNIYVSQDLFVHRYEPSTAEPISNEPEEEGRRALAFARKWGLKAPELGSFDPGPMIARGFQPERDRIPLEDIVHVERSLRESYDAIFIATCAEESDLEAVSGALQKYLTALRPDDAVLFAIGVGGELDVEVVGARARAVARKAKSSTEQTPDVVIAVIKPNFDWLAALPSGPRRRVYDACDALGEIEPLEDVTPSGYRRAVATLANAAQLS